MRDPNFFPSCKVLPLVLTNACFDVVINVQLDVQQFKTCYAFSNTKLTTPLTILFQCLRGNIDVCNIIQNMSVILHKTMMRDI